MRLFGRKNKVEEAEDMATPAYANTSVNQIMQPRTPAERQDRREKGIDIDMIDPEEVVRELESLAHYIAFETVQAVDKDGAPLFEDAPILDGCGNPIYTEIPYETPSGVVMMQKQVVLVKTPIMTRAPVKKTRPWALAALVYLNKVWPTIWMSPYEADTKKLVLRIAFYDIRKSMTWDEKRRYGVILRAVENLCVARLEDTKDGHKPLLMKVESHKLEVSTNRGLTNANK